MRRVVRDWSAVVECWNRMEHPGKAFAGGGVFEGCHKEGTSLRI